MEASILNFIDIYFLIAVIVLSKIVLGIMPKRWYFKYEARLIVLLCGIVLGAIWIKWVYPGCTQDCISKLIVSFLSAVGFHSYILRYVNSLIVKGLKTE